MGNQDQMKSQNDLELKLSLYRQKNEQALKWERSDKKSQADRSENEKKELFAEHKRALEKKNFENTALQTNVDKWKGKCDSIEAKAAKAGELENTVKTLTEEKASLMENH